MPWDIKHFILVVVIGLTIYIIILQYKIAYDQLVLTCHDGLSSLSVTKSAIRLHVCEMEDYDYLVWADKIMSWDLGQLQRCLDSCNPLTGSCENIEYSPIPDILDSNRIFVNALSGCSDAISGGHNLSRIEMEGIRSGICDGNLARLQETCNEISQQR